MSSLWVWPFELEEKIGEGGMGVVYRGRYVKNDRRVAVKLLPAEVADKTVLARFEREVKILRDLRHPNIVHSFGGVCEDDRRFYAMELVPGGTLEELLETRGGRLPWEQVVEYGLQMCAALHYAHERGVVHRDVKPGNFLLTKSGNLKLSDFGLATIIAGSNLTSDGRTVGSFRYMSPEQVRGTKEPLPSTDLYSLGCVLMKLLTGRPPFEGTTAADLLNKHLTEQPPRVSAMCPECPASLDALVDSLLSKDPKDRPADAKEVALQLKQISPVTRLSDDETRESIAPQKRVVLPPAPQTPVAKTPATFHWPLLVVAFLAGAGLWWASARLIDANRLRDAEQIWVDTYQSEKESEEIRIHAAQSLGKLGAGNSAIVETLEEGLDDASSRVRKATASALGEVGGNAKSVLPKLIAIEKKDSDREVAVAASAAIKKIREAPDPTGLGTYLFWIAVLVVAVVVAILYLGRSSAAAR